MADAGGEGKAASTEKASDSDSPPAAQFEWVHDSASQRSLIRRHTMKTSWRKRSQLSNAQKANKNSTRELRPLLRVPEREGSKAPGPGSEAGPIKATPRGLHTRHAQHLTVDVKRIGESAASEAGEEMQPAGQSIQELALRSPGRVIPRARVLPTSGPAYGSGGADGGRSLITFAPNVYFVDPFNCSPIPMGPRDQSLLHWWLGTYSTLMFGANSKEGEEPAIMEVDRGTFVVPGAFHAGLAYMAMHRSALTGEDWTFASIHHKIEALRLVNEQFDSQETATNNAAVYSVIRLLTLEDWWGNREVYNVHLKGLERMMRIRGGGESLRSNLDLEASYLGLRLIGRPKWFDPPGVPSPPPTQSLPLGLPKTTATLWETRQELFNSCRSFAQFFHSIQTLHLATLNRRCRPTPDAHPHICQVIEIIRSPLNQDYNVQPPYESHVGETICVVLLFYLTVVWQDHTLSAQPQKDLLQDLEEGLRKSAHRWRSAFGMLIFSMHKIETHNMGHTKRFHSVLGLMDVARYLPWDSWMKVRAVLQDVLLGNPSNISTWSELTELSLVEALVRCH